MSINLEATEEEKTSQSLFDLYSRKLSWNFPAPLLSNIFSLHSSFKEAFEKCMEFLPKETQTILVRRTIVRGK